MGVEEYEAIVIGGGPGGYVAGIRLGQLGVKTLLIEKEHLGGECLNKGCIPSKILIHGVSVYWSAKSSKWIVSERLGVDWQALQGFRESVCKQLREGVRYLLQGNGVRVVEGAAKLAEDMVVEVETREGVKKRFRGENIVIATGAEHAAPQSIPFDGERVITSSQALELPKIPEKMLIVGGGASGLEIGTVYAKLGTKLVVVELMDQLLPGVERDLVSFVQRRLKSLGAEIHLSSKVVSSKVSEKGVEAEVEGKDGSFKVEAEYAMVAVGKRAATEQLGVRELGVEVDDRGFIRVDEYASTNVEGVYAVGDVTGPPFLAHKASAQGLVAAENIAGREAMVDYDSIPSAIFTDPEIALVGLTKGEAEERGFRVRVGRFGFAALGRALAEGNREGFVRVVADAETGKVLGVQMVGPHVSELIGEASIAVRNGLTVEQFAKAVRPHPTYSEAVMEAAEAALWKPIHMLVK